MSDIYDSITPPVLVLNASYVRDINAMSTLLGIHVLTNTFLENMYILPRSG